MSGGRKQLSELLRPQQLTDLMLPKRHICRLQRMVERGSFQSLLLYGKPGLGKTSAARILLNTAGSMASLEINGSSAGGVDFVREHVEQFAKSVSFDRNVKLCFIDEADYVSRNAQAALRKVIEDYSDNCRFLLAANDTTKLLPAICSRLVEVCFDIAPSDRPEVKARLLDRYKRTLSELGMTLDDERLVQLIAIYFPDLRSIANHVEFEFGL